MTQIAGSTVATFNDIEVLRFESRYFESLPLNEKIYIYYLVKASEAGRNIVYKQNGKENLLIKEILECIYCYSPYQQQDPQWQLLEEYLYNFWFSAGIHHHCNNYRLTVGFSREFFKEVVLSVKERLLAKHSEEEIQRVEEILFSPELYPYNSGANVKGDSLSFSSVDFYEKGITAQEATEYYQSVEEEWRSQHPDSAIMPPWGLNTRLQRDLNRERLIEKSYSTEGIYSEELLEICHYLSLAREYAPSPQARKYISTLIRYYERGDLEIFDQFCVEWVQDSDTSIDFINGFIETYSDPLGRKGMWEGCVFCKNTEANHRAWLLSQNAQWFEDHAPIDPQFKKKRVSGVSARVVEMLTIGGDNFPATAIGINLPNSNDIRKQYGSKSITIDNLTHAYAQSEGADKVFKAFVSDHEVLRREKEYGERGHSLHTDLHECLGHGSGQLKEGVSPDALGPFSSTIEEARADLFALYYIADPKIIEMGLLPDGEAYKSEYFRYLNNGLLVQWARIPLGKICEEAHMQNRALIARYILEKGQESCALELNELHLQIYDYNKIREYIGELLREIQRIKSEGDLHQAEALIQRYALTIDPELHEAIIIRYKSCQVKPYKGFVNPRFVPQYNEKGEIQEVTPDYQEGYAQQMLRLSTEYASLSDDTMIREQVRQIKQTLPTRMNGETAQSMRNYGASYFVNWGISHEHLAEIAGRYTPSIALSTALYRSSVRDLQIIALHLFPQEKLSSYYIDYLLSRSLSNEIAEAMGFYLLRKQKTALDWTVSYLTRNETHTDRSTLLSLHVLLRWLKDRQPIAPELWKSLVEAITTMPQESLSIAQLRLARDLVLQSAQHPDLQEITQNVLQGCLSEPSYIGWVSSSLWEDWCSEIEV